MQGLILVTWEKFLTDQFGEAFVKLYRKSIKQAPSDVPLVSKTYDDDVFPMAVGAAVQLAKTDTQPMLYEYGRYFMLNPLVNHQCGYIFSRIHNTRDMILVMRKAQMEIGPSHNGMTPPLFACNPIAGNPNSLTVTFDKPRQFCALLHGAIVGAGDYYKEHIQVKEQSCLLKGNRSCQFEVTFEASGQSRLQETDVQYEQRLRQQKTENRVLTALPYTQEEAQSLLELQKSLALRPLTLLEALNHLHFVGLVSMQPAEELMSRRYWRTQV